MRRTRTAILACLLAVPACTDHEPATQPPTTATTAIAPTQAPPAEPAPPELPALAQRRTTAGAKAFVTYYIDVLNYLHADTHVQALAAASSPECRVCRSIATTRSRMAREGGAQVGGDWTISSITRVPATTTRGAVLLVAIDIEAGSFRRSEDGPEHRIEARRVVYEFHAAWMAGTWRMTDVRST